MVLKPGKWNWQGESKRPIHQTMLFFPANCILYVHTLPVACIAELIYTLQLELHCINRTITMCCLLHWNHVLYDAMLCVHCNVCL